MSIKVMTLVWERSQHGGTELLGLLAMADHAHDNGGGIRIGRKRLARKARKSPRTIDALIERLLASGELVRTHKGGNGPRDPHHYAINVRQLQAQPYVLGVDEDEPKVADSATLLAAKVAETRAKVAAAAATESSLLETKEGREDEAARAPASKNWTEAAFDAMAARASRSEWERKIADDRKISDESWRDAMLAFTRAFPDARYDRDLWVGQRGANISKFVAAWGGSDELLAKAVELMRGRAAQDPMFAARHPAMLVPYLDAARLQQPLAPEMGIENGHGGITRPTRAAKTPKRVWSPDEITMLQMHPRVAIHREVFGPIGITPEQMDDIVARGPVDEALWKRCCEEWLRARWRADNVAGLVSMAIVEEKRAGLPAGGHTAQRGRSVTLPQIADPTDAERAVSEERARQQRAERAWRREMLSQPEHERVAWAKANPYKQEVLNV